MKNGKKILLGVLVAALLATVAAVGFGLFPEDSAENTLGEADTEAGKIIEDETVAEVDGEAEELDPAVTEALYRKDSQGSVSVGIGFLNPIEEDGEYLNFVVALNTHSVDLDGYDLSELTSLKVGSHPEITDDIQWTDIEGGGHHVFGTVKVPKATEQGAVDFRQVDQIELIVKNLDGIESRSFVWEMKELQDVLEGKYDSEGNSSPKASYGYVANTDDGSISVIDTLQDEVVDTFYVAEGISDGLAANPNNREIYTADYNEGVLIIIDGDTGEIINEISLNRNLHGIDLSPDGKSLYITSGALEEDDEFNYIMIYDTEEGEIVEEIRSASSSPSHISFSGDGGRAFISNVMSNDVTVMDTDSLEVIDTIPVGRVPNEGKALHDGTRLYVASLMDHVLSVVDVTMGEEVGRIPAGEGTHGVAVTEDEKQVWTANRNSNDVTVIDAASEEVIKTIETGEMPNHIFQVPGTNKMYVSNLESNDVTVIDMETYQVTAVIAVGEGPHEIGFLPK